MIATEKSHNQENRLPYQPPTLTKRGNIRKLTQNAILSIDVTGDGNLDIFKDTNSNNIVDTLDVPQTGNTSNVLTYNVSPLTLNLVSGFDVTGPAPASTDNVLTNPLDLLDISVGGILNVQVSDTNELGQLDD